MASRNSKAKKFWKIVAWILIILLLIGAIAIILRFTNNGTDEFKTFYVEQDGKIFATSDRAEALRGMTATFDVRYTFDKLVNKEKRDFTVAVVASAATEFEFEAGGVPMFYRDGTDMTAAFQVAKDVEAGKFTLKLPMTMSEALKTVYGKEIVLEEEPDLGAEPYFKILVTSYNEANTITLSLLLKTPKPDRVELDRTGIVFDGESEAHSITYSVTPPRSSGQDTSSMVGFQCRATAYAGETVTFTIDPKEYEIFRVELFETGGGSLGLLTPQDGIYSFCMPDAAVRVSISII